MLNRRNLLAGLGIGLAAPAIIRTPGLLMSVRPLPIRRTRFVHMPRESVITAGGLNQSFGKVRVASTVMPGDLLGYVIQNGQLVYYRMSDIARYIQG